MAQDFRGKMFRSNRQVPDAAAQAFLSAQKILHIGTVDADDFPYVVPESFIYEGGNELWFHTGWHQGHLFHNLQHSPKLCVETAQIGALTPVKDGYACDSSLICGSVIAFGTAEVIEDRERKNWFFDKMVAKYGDPSLEFKPGYPMIDRIILFRMKIEILTGKENSGRGH
jgi:nitroimidazol reductase NimA-like FMN-containing flavoprotein (pyridoxamine 5'-phosphate oxidase superfamily)